MERNNRIGDSSSSSRCVEKKSTSPSKTKRSIVKLFGASNGRNRQHRLIPKSYWQILSGLDIRQLISEGALGVVNGSVE